MVDKLKAHRVTPDLKAHRAQQVQLVLKDLKVRPELRAQQVHKAPQELEVRRVKQAP
jgi:hypothetical protein